MTLILGAMEREVGRARRELKDSKTIEWNSYRFHRGRIGDCEVLVAGTGVGKSLSAMVCQHLIDVTAPDRILFSGIAGALNPTLEIGDTVIARDCIFHDMDATAFGFTLGEIPYTAHRVIACDPGLVERAAAVRPLSGKVLVGRVLTGDQFIASAERRRELRTALDGDAVEMEGASIGLVAAVNRIPFLLIRTISDGADGESSGRFASFLRFATRNSWHYLRQIVE